jgi:hypothetical protein
VLIQRRWRTYLLQSRISLLARLATLASSVDTRELCIDRESYARLQKHHHVGGPVYRFAEHAITFAFDPYDAVFLVEHENAAEDQATIRQGIPEWTNVEVPILSNKEVVMYYGEGGIGMQDGTDVLPLLHRGVEAKDVENDRSAVPVGSPEEEDATPFRLLRFGSVEEARRRIAILLACTWDPKARAGVELIRSPFTSSAPVPARQHVPLRPRSELAERLPLGSPLRRYIGDNGSVRSAPRTASLRTTVAFSPASTMYTAVRFRLRAPRLTSASPLGRRAH